VIVESFERRGVHQREDQTSHDIRNGRSSLHWENFQIRRQFVRHFKLEVVDEDIPWTIKSAIAVGFLSQALHEAGKGLNFPFSD